MTIFSEGVQQSPALSAKEEDTNLRRTIELYKQAELKMLARALAAEAENKRLREALMSIRAQAKKHGAEWAAITASVVLVQP